MHLTIPPTWQYIYIYIYIWYTFYSNLEHKCQNIDDENDVCLKRFSDFANMYNNLGHFRGGSWDKS